MPNPLLQSAMLAHLEQYNQKIYWQDSSREIRYGELLEMGAWKEDELEYWQLKSLPTRSFVILEASDGPIFFAHFLKALSLGWSVLIKDPYLSRERFETLAQSWGLFLQDQKPIQMDSPLIAMSTSGSSGMAKLILHTPETLNASWSQLYSTLGSQFSHWGLCLPIHHMGGLMVLIRQFLSGGTVVKIDDEMKILPELEAISLVPAQLTKFLREGRGEWLRDCKFILMGGAAADLKLWQSAFRERLALHASYGATETASVIAMTKSLREESVLPTTRPVIGRELVGVNCHFDSQGNIQIKAPSVAPYIVKDQKLFETDGVFETNDRGRRDDQGMLVHLGRSDTIFICGGENISPEEMESFLRDEEEIEDVVIIPRPHKTLGFVPHMSFKLRGESSPSRRLEVGRRLLKRLEKEYPQKFRPRSFDAELEVHGLKPKRYQLQEKMAKREVELEGHARWFFLHGLFGLVDDFDEVLSALETNHGLDPLCLFSLDLLNDSLMESKEQLLTRLEKQIMALAQGEEVILVGYSLGGRILLELLDRGHIKRVKGFALLSSHPGLDDSEERQARYLHDQKLLSKVRDQNDFCQFLKSWYEQKLFGQFNKLAHFQKRLEGQQKLPPKIIENLLVNTSLGLQKSYWQTLATYPAKKLYLAGSEDQRYVEVAYRLKAQGMETEIIDHCAHALHGESPLKVAQSLASFFGEN